MKMKKLFNKVAKFAQILGILNNMIKPTLVQKFSRIKIYNTLALPSLLEGSEIWALRQKDKNRLTPVVMKFFRTAGHTHFDHKGKDYILEELKVKPVDEKLRRDK
jgi:hypothetical protein